MFFFSFSYILAIFSVVFKARKHLQKQNYRSGKETRKQRKEKKKIEEDLPKCLMYFVKMSWRSQQKKRRRRRTVKNSSFFSSFHSSNDVLEKQVKVFGNIWLLILYLLFYFSRFCVNTKVTNWRNENNRFNNNRNFFFSLF